MAFVKPCRPSTLSRTRILSINTTTSAMDQIKHRGPVGARDINSFSVSNSYNTAVAGLPSHGLLRNGREGAVKLHQEGKTSAPVQQAAVVELYSGGPTAIRKERSGICFGTRYISIPTPKRLRAEA